MEKKFIEKFKLKAGADAVFAKARRNLRITDQEILNILPLELWFDKKKINAITLIIHQQLEAQGIIIGKRAIPEQEASNFSLETYFPFTLLPATQAESISRSVEPPHYSRFESTIPVHDEVVLVAFGSICVEQICEDGKINRLKYFSEGEFFLSTDDFHVTAATSYAFFWKFSRKKIPTFPPIISKFLEFISEKEFDTLRWISAKTELNSTRRHKLTCDYIDEKYPSAHILHTSDEERSSIANFSRETVTRRKKNKPPRANEGP